MIKRIQQAFMVCPIISIVEIENLKKKIKWETHLLRQVAIDSIEYSERHSKIMTLSDELAVLQKIVKA